MDNISQNDNIEKLDRELAQIQKSTRTVFSFMVPLHDKLRMTFGWYYKWHLSPIYNVVNLALVVLATGAMVGVIGLNIFGQTKFISHAASKQIWGSTGSWDGWTLENIETDLSTNSLALKGVPEETDSGSLTEYSESGTAQISYTAYNNESVDWLAAESDVAQNNQTLSVQYSTDKILWTDDIGTLANSAEIFIRISLATDDIEVSPKVNYLAINYSRLPNPPSGLSFENRQNALGNQQILHTGIFSDPDNDLHRASQWQISDKAGDFTNPIIDSGAKDSGDLTSYKIDNNLSDGQYSFRVRYQDTTGAWGLWSEGSFFELKNHVLALSVAPGGEIPADASEIQSKRTETSKTSYNPDGTFTLNAYSGIIHYKDDYKDESSESWKDINPSHSIDNPEYVLFDQMPSTVKVFKDKIGYEIESRKTGDKYTVELQAVDGNPKLSRTSNQQLAISNKLISWADINAPQTQNSKLKTQNYGLSHYLNSAIADESAVTQDDGNLKFEFEIGEYGVRLWKTITGPDAPKNFKWNITKTEGSKDSSINDLKFRENPDAFEVTNTATAAIDASKPVTIQTKKLVVSSQPASPVGGSSVDSTTSFTWTETAPQTDLKIDTDVIYYPDADAESTSVDGNVVQTVSGDTWSSMQGGAGTGFADSSAQGKFMSIEGAPSSTWDQMYRSIFLFDTSALSGTVNSATASFYGASKTDGLNITPDINLYASAPASNTALAAGDFDSLGTTAFSTAITYANFSVAGYNDFALNASGIAAIDIDGITKLGLRNANYDAAVPTVEPVSSTAVSFLVGYFADQADTTYDPKLAINYTPAALPPIAPSGVYIDTMTTAGFTVHWTDNSSDETGFKVYVSTTPTSGLPTPCDATATYALYDTTAAGVIFKDVIGQAVNFQYCAKVLATNGSGDSAAAYAAAPKYTLANVPDAPTVDTPTATSLKVTINANSNPAATEFAILNETANKYVKADGSMTDTTPVWQTVAGWNTTGYVVNTGLSVNTTYTYKVKARNGDTTETALSSGASKYTLANVPSAPTLSSLAATSIKVNITDNSSTKYAIKVVYGATTKYLKTDGTLQDTEAWDTYTNFGGASGKTNTGLSVNTQYTYSVAGQNGDGTATSYSSTALNYTLANVPDAPTVDTPTATSLKVTINANSNPAATEFAILNETANKYVKADGSMTDTTPVWQTVAQWNTTGYVVNTGLTSNTSYTYKVKARNGDTTATDLSTGASNTTLTAINISGSCKKYNESTNCADSETVKVAVNAVLQAETGTTSTGSWTIINVPSVVVGDIITVFVDGVVDSLEANAVTKYDGTGNITGVLLYEDHLTIGSADNQNLSNTNLSQYDNSASADEDIFFDVDTGNLIVDDTAQSTQEKLFILALNTLTPGGNITTHDLDLNGTLVPEANTVNVAGSWDATGGTFTKGTSTVNFNGTTAGETITTNAQEFYNMTVAGSDGGNTDTGAHSPTTGADIGGGLAAWTNPGYVISSNDQNASLTDASPGESNWLYASDYNLGLPSNAVVTGIIVGIEAMQTPVSASFTYVYLTTTGADYASANKGTDQGVPGVNNQYTYFGASDDDWSNTLTTADFNSSGFGVKVKFSYEAGITLTVDHINVKVYYTTPAADWTLQDDTTVSNTLTMTSGVLTAGANTVTTKDYSQGGGIFSAPTPVDVLNVSGNFSQTAGNITHNSGTINFTKSGNQTIGATETLYNIIKSGSGTLQTTTTLTAAGTLTISAGTTFDQNGQTTTIGTLSNDGTFQRTGAETLTITTQDTDSGTFLYVGRDVAETLTIKDFGTNDYYNLTVNDTNTDKAVYQAAVALTIKGNLSVASSDTAGNGVNLNNQTTAITGNVSLTGGKLTAGSAAISVAGDWTLNGGTFTANTSTVTLSGAGGSTQILTGSTTFNNLTATAATARTLTFTGNSTTAVSGTWTVTGASAQLITLQSSDTNAWNINPTTPNVSYVNVSRSNNTSGTNICATYSTDSLNNTAWTITGLGFCGVSIAGTVYSAEDKLTNIGVDKTVAASVNGGAKYAAETNASGQFTISVPSIADANPIVVFVDDETGISANLVTLASGTGGVSGLELYTGKIVLTHENAGPMTNTALNTANNSADSDIHYTDDGGFDTAYELFIQSGKTYTPGGTVTSIGDFDINGTFVPASNTVNVYGSWDATGGTFTNTGSTITFVATASKNITSDSESFNNLTFNGAGGTWTAQDASIAAGTLTLTRGTFDANDQSIGCQDMTATGAVARTLKMGNGTWTVAGNWDSSGTNQTVTPENSTVILTGDGNLQTKAISVAPYDFYNLQAAANGKTTTALTSVSVNNDLTLSNGGTFFLNGWISVRLYKSTGDPLALNGATVTNGATEGTIIYRPSSSISVAGGTFNSYLYYSGITNDVTITLTSAVSAEKMAIYGFTSTKIPTLDTGGQDISAADLYIGYYDPNLAYSGTLLANNSTINVSGGLTIQSASAGDTNTLNAMSSTINVGGNWNANGGTFTKGTSTVNLTGASGSTQTISGDTTFNNLTATATATRTLTFAGNSTQIVTGTWTVAGASGQLITMQSSDSNNWTINPTAASVSYVNVSGSTNTGVIFCATYSTDAGSNVSWRISANGTCPYSTIQFTSASSSGAESVANVNIGISLSAVQVVDAYVSYAVTGGTATGGGVDYTLADGTALIAAGSTSVNIPLTIINDTIDEPNETIIVTLSNPTNAVLGVNITYTYTITDDDNPPTVQFSASSGSGSESVLAPTIRVTLSQQSAFNVTANYAATGGTATGGGVDYILNPGTLTISAGQTYADLPITIINDTLDELDETVIITLSSPTNASLGAVTVHTYTINDDDASPQVFFTTPASSGSESYASVGLEISLSTVSGRDVIVNYEIIGGTATQDIDYTMPSTSVVISAGSISATILLSIIDDTLVESDETVIVRLSSASGASIVSLKRDHTYTIIDNDIIQYYTIQASVIGNGIINPAGTISVAEGASQSFAFVPSTGYEIAEVIKDGIGIGSPASYTFVNVRENHTIVVRFQIKTFTITARSMDGGSAVAPTSQVVQYGQSALITINVNAGYHLSSITDNGTIMPVYSQSIYEIGFVAEDHLVSFSTSLDYYTLTIIKSGNGSGVFSEQSQTVTRYSNITVIATPDDSSIFGGWSGDITSNEPSVLLNNFSGDVTIIGTFTLKKLKIDVLSSQNGAITPGGVVYVNYGETREFQMVPDPGYFVSNVYADSKPLGPLSSYTFVNITSNHTIKADFSIFQYQIKAVSIGKGSALPAEQTIEYGGDAKITLSPEAGNIVAKIVDNGVVVPTVSEYFLKNIHANHIVEVYFGESEIRPSDSKLTIVTPRSQFTNQLYSNVNISWKYEGPNTAKVSRYRISYQTNTADFIILDTVTKDINEYLWNINDRICPFMAGPGAIRVEALDGDNNSLDAAIVEGNYTIPKVSIEINSADNLNGLYEIKGGDSFRFEATVKADGVSAEKEVVWESDQQVGSISQSGLFKAKYVSGVFDNAVSAIVNLCGQRSMAQASIKIIAAQKPTSTETISSTTLAAGTAAAVGVTIATGAIANTASLLSLSELWNYLLMPFLLFGSRRRRENRWGRVLEEGSGLAIPMAKVTLLKIEDFSKRPVATSFSDKDGYYGFVAGPGRYVIEVTKDMYHMAEIPGYYTPGREIVVTEERQGLIVPTIVMAMTEESLKKKLNFFRNLGVYERVSIIVAWVILLVSSVISVNNLIKYPDNPYVIGIAALNIFLWILNISNLFNKSPWGKVLDRNNLAPLSLSLVRVMDPTGTRLVRTTITNEEGKFSTILPKGQYRVLVAKSGYKQKEPMMLRTDDPLNLVNKKILIDKNI